MAWKITLRFHGPNALCKLVAYVQVVAMFAASYVLVATAVDRYIAVCHPLKTHVWTARRMHLVVVVAWIAALTFAAPQMVVFAKRPVSVQFIRFPSRPQRTVCTASKNKLLHY